MQFANEWTKHLAFGVGIGLGIGVIAYQLHRGKERQREELSETIEKLADEVRQLKETFILLQKASSNVAADVMPKKSQTRGSQLRETNDDDDDDDDDDDEFFDSSQSPMLDAIVESIDEASKSEISKVLGNLPERLEKADQLRDGSSEDMEENYNILLKLSQEISLSCELLWRLCRAQYDMAILAGKRGDQEEKLNLIKQGMKTGRQALDIDDNNASAHKWYGILIGHYTEFCGPQEKIKYGYEYKQCMERAIELNPLDPSGYSLLGRWRYEVYMLPWYLRKVAAAIFADPPTSTAEEALQCAMKAEKLKPNFWKENMLLIAKMSDYKKTKEWLLKANDLATKTEDDRLAQNEIEELLAKL